jgi:hypothetical protein
MLCFFLNSRHELQLAFQNKNKTGTLIRIRMDFGRKVNENILNLTFFLSCLRQKKSKTFLRFLSIPRHPEL